jgi:hypothetical protein
MKGDRRRSCRPRSATLGIGGARSLPQPPSVRIFGGFGPVSGDVSGCRLPITPQRRCSCCVATGSRSEHRVQGRPRRCRHVANRPSETETARPAIARRSAARSAASSMPPQGGTRIGAGVAVGSPLRRGGADGPSRGVPDRPPSPHNSGRSGHAIVTRTATGRISLNGSKVVTTRHLGPRRASRPGMPGAPRGRGPRRDRPGRGMIHPLE